MGVGADFFETSTKNLILVITKLALDWLEVYIDVCVYLYVCACVCIYIY